MVKPNDAERATARVTDANIRRLERVPSPPGGRSETGETDKTETKQRQPQDRKSEPVPPQPPRGSDRPGGRRVTTNSLRRPLLFALLPLALVLGGYFYVTGGAVMSTDNAYVQADMVGVSTDVSGLVREVDVHDNQKVTKGEVLFKLDPLQFQLALDRANAQLASTRRRSRARCRPAIATCRPRSSRRRRTSTSTRSTSSASSSWSPTTSRRRPPSTPPRNTLQGAQQKLASLQAAARRPRRESERQSRRRRSKTIRATRTRWPRATRRRASSPHTVVRAPFAGIVTNVPSLQPGQYLAAAADRLQHRLERPRLDPGQPEGDRADLSSSPDRRRPIEVDTYPGQQWTGTVDSISPASASSFSLLPAENTSGNWVKVVQRIPVRVSVDNAPGKPPLRVGMSVDVSVDTGHERGLPSFLIGLVQHAGSRSWLTPQAAPRALNRAAITACVILAVIMQALDTTIANVALPYMQGSVSASADQINWVLTSYIVAAAIMTPPSGFLANRFGRQRVLMVAIAGFVLASVLCGIAQSLFEIVAFRLMQGFFGAALVPISQSILLDIYTPEERGSAMALFGVSVMVGPVLGPVIGGWLTDHFSWRWIFYINVPLGALAFAGIWLFLRETQG